MNTLPTENDLERFLSLYLRRDMVMLSDKVLNATVGIDDLIDRAREMAGYPQYVVALDRGCQNGPHGTRHAIDSALTEIYASGTTHAGSLQNLVDEFPDAWEAGLHLGNVYERSGSRFEALASWNASIAVAQAGGECLGDASTPPSMLATVAHAVERIRGGKACLLLGTLDRVEREQQAAAGSLDRVRAAVEIYLKQRAPKYASDHQRPRFLYVPDLSSEPWLDPSFFDWAATLEEHHELLLADALQVLEGGVGIEDFIRPGPRTMEQLSGTGGPPKWEAFFFYRHGKKFEANHARCPRTGSLLESLDLCRIDGHAPEICFSVLRSGTRIRPHYGVTNIRSVVHLPLVVPPNCGIKIMGAGERKWETGKMLAFDDTFCHEAWNNSNDDRIILLMDCWNPYLSSLERFALTKLISIIAGWHAG